MAPLSARNQSAGSPAPRTGNPSSSTAAAAASTRAAACGRRQRPTARNGSTTATGTTPQKNASANPGAASSKAPTG